MNRVSPSRWLFLPIQWPEQWGLQASLQWQEGGNCRTGDLGLSSSKLGSWSSPFTPECPPGHGLWSSGLLPLFSRFRISAEVEIRQALPRGFTGDDATHMWNFLGQHPHQTR